MMTSVAQRLGVNYKSLNTCVNECGKSSSEQNTESVNPTLRGQELLGQKVYGTLAEIPTQVDMVDVFRNASFLQGIVEETIALKINVIWTQLGVIDQNAISLAESSDIRVVMDKCPAIEIPRLRTLGYL